MSVGGEIAVGVIVGVVSAFASTGLALRQYRSERWWDKKYDAYTVILNSLHSLLQDVEAEYKELNTGAEPTEEQQAERNKRYREAISEIERHISLGTFLLRHTAVEALIELKKGLKEAQNTQDFTVYLSAAEWAYWTALTRIRNTGEAELSVSRSDWMNRFRRKYFR